MTKAGALSLFTRRRFLAVGAAAIVMPHIASAAALATGQRKLSLANTHTGETLTTVYWQKGEYVGDALHEIDFIMRDFRTGDVHAIDPKLLDLLNGLHRKVDSRRPYLIVSGYRSPQTNAELAEHSDGVAKRSLHMEGMAMDLRLEDVRLKTLRKAAVALEAGGVGYYPNSNFVHVDVGRVRTW